MPDSQPYSAPFTQEELQNYCASQAIDQQFCRWPEFRLELVDGQFLVGGTVVGSSWLLKEALIGWGLEAAIAFAPIEQWWEALRLAYGVSCQSEDDWLQWAESLPLSPDYRQQQWPPLGSRYGGEHRWVRDLLSQGLSFAVIQAGLGKCFGPNYGMQLEQNVLTPDILMHLTECIAQDTCHSYYTEAAAHLVVEISLPEQSVLDTQVRQALYEKAGIPHYWVVDPVVRQVEFWQWSSQGYQRGGLDPDGFYRGVDGFSFSPEIFWLEDEQKAPAFTSVWRPRQWELRYEPGEELGYGSLPFAPSVNLTPQPIHPEQFIAWCPETKLEVGPFPLIGGGQTGTRNAIAMLMMSLGLIETVKLMAGYEWVRALRRVTRQQQQDAQQREVWWRQAKKIARQLKTEQGIGGVGVIGALLNDQPLNPWSTIHLVIWGAPDDFDRWRFWQTLPQMPPIELTEVERALPGEWTEISQQMRILEGLWGNRKPLQPKRMKFYWTRPGA